MLEVDFHCHSNQSCHALNSLDELLRQADKNQMSALCITDHSPGMDNNSWLQRQTLEHKNGEHRINGPDLAYFKVLLERYQPPEELKVTLFKGIECNLILEGDKACDVPLSLVEYLDIIIVSLHPLEHIFSGKSREKCTGRFVKVLEEPVDILGHPFHFGLSPDFEVIVPLAAEKGIALELNNSSFALNRADPKAVSQMLKLAKQYSCGISLGSDAHAANELGQDQFLREIIRDNLFPPELIVNRSLERAREFIQKRKEFKKQLILDNTNP